MIAAIVARSENGVIGVNNDLPWDIPADRKHFRNITTGHTVIMGRKTAESIVGRLGHGLPNRHNIVISRSHELVLDGFTVVHSLDEAFAIIKDETAFIIGGEQIYKLGMSYCDRLYITEVAATVDGDALFPEVDPTLWRETSRDAHKKDEKNDFDFAFVTYDRIV